MRFQRPFYMFIKRNRETKTRVKMMEFNFATQKREIGKFSFNSLE